MGSKGIGEIGIVGSPAAIANAVYHATGIRVRDLRSPQTSSYGKEAGRTELRGGRVVRLVSRNVRCHTRATLQAAKEEQLVATQMDGQRASRRVGKK